MAKEEYDCELKKSNNEMMREKLLLTENLTDGRTDLEISQEKTIQKLIEENNKLKIENDLMRELLSRPISYTYGIR